MIVCSFKNDVYTQGLSAALTSIYGEEFKLWQPDRKPIHDMYDELSPDVLFIHQDYNNVLVEHVENILKEFRHTIIYVLKPNLELANVVHYNKGKKQNYLTTDIIYWSRTNVTDELVNNLWKIAAKYTLKIFGPVRVNMPHYLGNLDFLDMSDALASAKLNFDFDTSCNRFDAAVNNTYSFCWSNDSKNLMQELDKTMNAKHKVQSLKDDVFSKYTYHHHLNKTFKSLGMEEESKILADLEKYK